MSEALLVIDLQRDYFVDDELERCRDDLVATVSGLVRAALAAGVLVVEVRTEHDTGGRSWTLTMHEDGVGPAMAGTPGAARVPGLDVLDAATIVVVKHRDSAFFQTTLAAQLRQRGVDRVVLVGVSTESCVLATAIDAFAHDFGVTLVADATASIDPALHEHTLGRLAEQYRQRVARADEVARAWQQPPLG